MKLLTNMKLAYFGLTFSLMLTFCSARNDLSDKEYLGAFKFVQHLVQGHAYALDDNTIFVHRFYYDGEGPPGVTFVAVPNGEKDYEKGTSLKVQELKATSVPRTFNQNYTLTLPKGMKVKDVERLVFWCAEYGVSFGRVDLKAARETPKIKRDLDRPNLDLELVGPLTKTEHAVSGTVYIEDKSSIVIKDFNYDGQGPSVVLYAGEDNTLATGYYLQYPYKAYVSRLGPTSMGRIRKRDIRVRLPKGLNAYKLKWLSVWCNTFEISFGHVNFE